MPDYPIGPVSGALAYLFLQKLGERLERENKLLPGETRRIWAEILAELQGDTRALSGQCRDTIVNQKLAEP